MQVLVVPMSPEFLPEAALLLAGVFAGVIALRHLFARQLSGALRAGAIGVACIALAFVLARTHGERPKESGAWQQLHKPPKAIGLLPAAQPAIRKDSGPAPPMSLLLGDVLLLVTPSDRYVLSVDDKQFLVLDSIPSGLMVEGSVGAHDKLAATISRNLFPFYRSGIQPSRPDAHTLLLRESGKDIFRVHFAEPRKIEVTGSFFLGSGDSSSVTFENGIRWSGAGIPPGTTLDLINQGKGRIDFERSGLIRILPF